MGHSVTYNVMQVKRAKPQRLFKVIYSSFDGYHQFDLHTTMPLIITPQRDFVDTISYQPVKDVMRPHLHPAGWSHVHTRTESNSC